MNPKLIVAALAIAAVPLCAQAQQPSGQKVTKAELQKVIKIISGDKDKAQTYCDIVKLNRQLDEAYGKNNTKAADELSQKVDELEKKLGPEYVALMEELQDMEPESGRGSTLKSLDKLCAK